MSTTTLIDTHCHLTYLINQENNHSLTATDHQKISAILSHAQAHDVKMIIHISTTIQESTNSIILAKAYPNVYATIGVHPNDITSDWPLRYQELTTLLANNQEQIIGIGECGLDYFHHPEHHVAQKQAFHDHIKLALKHNLPLIIHTRDAWTDFFEVMEHYRHEPIKGVLHCFSGNQEILDRLHDTPWYFGLGGIITYPKNNELREIIKKIPLTKILLETDAPFLPPQPFRGKQNHPAYIQLIARQLAQIRSIDYETIAQQTTANAQKLFGL
jgi:TatD DNase family protein